MFKGRKISNEWKENMKKSWEKRKRGKNIICLQCGESKYRSPSQLKHKFCSKQCWYNHNTGVNNYKFGKKVTKKELERIRKMNLGRKHSIQTRKKISIASRKRAKTGKDNILWKGGISTEENKTKGSFNHNYWKLEILEKYNFTCQKCFQAGNKEGNRINTHHIFNFADYPEKRFDIENGIILCEKCHREFHSIYGKKDTNNKQLKEYLKK